MSLFDNKISPLRFFLSCNLSRAHMFLSSSIRTYWPVLSNLSSSAHYPFCPTLWLHCEWCPSQRRRQVAVGWLLYLMLLCQWTATLQCRSMPRYLLQSCPSWRTMLPHLPRDNCCESTSDEHQRPLCWEWQRVCWRWRLETCWSR